MRRAALQCIGLRLDMFWPCVTGISWPTNQRKSACISTTYYRAMLHVGRHDVATRKIYVRCPSVCLSVRPSVRHDPELSHEHLNLSSKFFLYVSDRSVILDFWELTVVTKFWRNRHSPKSLKHSLEQKFEHFIALFDCGGHKMVYLTLSHAFDWRWISVNHLVSYQ